VLQYYDENGYPFAQIWVDSLAFDRASNSVDLSIYVVEGRPQTIDGVEFEGLTHTKKELAVKLSGLHPGESYDGERLRECYLRLSSSGVFREVSYPTVRMSPGGKGVEVLVRVVEPSGANSLSGALGYAERDGDQERVLSGLVRLDVTNIGGSLRDLHLHWQDDGQGRSETSLSYRERFFLGRRLALGIRLEQVGLDTLYTWQSLGLESSVPVGRLLGGIVGIDVGANADRNTFSEGGVSSTFRTRLSGGVTFVAGHEDRGGFLEFRTHHAYGRKEVNEREGGEGATISQYIFDAEVRATADATRSIHGAVELVYRDIETSEEFVPLAEQFYVGGASTIRGYRENQFHGRRAGYLRTELRVGKSNRENGYLFVDGGYILEESENAEGGVSKEDEYPVGYGFGLRTESKVGNIDISFGVGEELSLRATKVHVILNRSF
jgi:outer membrane protein insertion porin family